MAMTKRHGMKALLIWCQRATRDYPNVDVVDLTSSFKNGLAFCAILHRYRPDLINFDSLKPENVYENNDLAFKVAEERLDIPALLDPQDMVDFEEPDKFSVVTYVSQFYHAFKSEDSPMTMKRLNSESSSVDSSPSATPSSTESTPSGTPSPVPKFNRIPSGYVHNKIKDLQNPGNIKSKPNNRFNHADLLAKYGEEIFETSESKKSSNCDSRVNSLCSQLILKATICEEKEN